MFHYNEGNNQQSFVSHEAILLCSVSHLQGVFAHIIRAPTRSNMEVKLKNEIQLSMDPDRGCICSAGKVAASENVAVMMKTSSRWQIALAISAHFLAKE
jgi:hypothetical protein